MGSAEAEGPSECLREGNEGTQDSESKIKIILQCVDEISGVHGTNKLDKSASEFWPPPEKIGKNLENSPIDSDLRAKDDFDKIIQFPRVVRPQ